MVSNSIIGIEPVFHNLLRQIAGGDVSPRNLSLVDKMVDIMQENRLIFISTQIYSITGTRPAKARASCKLKSIFLFIRLMMKLFSLFLSRESVTTHSLQFN